MSNRAKNKITGEDESDDDYMLKHPVAGMVRQDREKVAVRWVEESSEVDKKSFTDELELVPLQNPTPPSDVGVGARSFMEVNHTPLLGWYEHKVKKQISKSILVSLEESHLVSWISSVYLSENNTSKSEVSPEKLFCINPTVLYLRASAAEALGDLTQIDPSLTVDTKRTSMMHGLTVLYVKDVSLTKRKGSTFISEKIISKLQAIPGFSMKDVIFENIPLIRPTCGCDASGIGLVCTPATSEFIPNDPLFSTQWALRRINASYAWPLSTWRSEYCCCSSRYRSRIVASRSKCTSCFMECYNTYSWRGPGRKSWNSLCRNSCREDQQCFGRLWGSWKL